MTGHDADETAAPDAPSRRRFLLGAVTGAAGGVLVGAGGVAALDGGSTGRATPTTSAGTPGVDPHGDHQAGVDRPAALQRHVELAVLDLPARLPSRDDVADLLDRVGERVTTLVVGTDPGLGGLTPTRLTVTVGVGPRVAAAFLGDDAPAAQPLPAFARDDLSPATEGGDVLLLVRCDVGPAAARAVLALRDETGLDVRWTATGFAGPPEGLAARNLLGFHDGLSIPRTDAELAATVWSRTPRGATTLVVRRMPIDVARFGAQPVDAQQRTIGRERATGAPLSGGTQADGPDLNAKTDDGQYLVPADAHVRRAHPLPAGLDGLMLRRSYSYADGPGAEGLLFMAFGADTDLFVRTQQRLDEQDALMAFTRATASASFLVLPGFTPGRGLGSVLRD
ncbi:Dyp-type peroxidase [Luteimicrobium subarcticum]|uniref:Dye decolorizing peroxidase n=1 Tax=Luteimicrobium subarcticum TaxID=620910 RepID=A0A2M8WJL5_9MICO|nr:Dyp-type peroxidase [Luteimicrobium subarcticum]PJI91124.1 dye decolorizing peroxidase [Luteimicrobium subarcticum]